MSEQDPFGAPVPGQVSNDPNEGGTDFHIPAAPSVYERQPEAPVAEAPIPEPVEPEIPDVEDMDDYFALLDRQNGEPEDEPEEEEESEVPATEPSEESVEDVLAADEKPTRENRRVREAVARASQAEAQSKQLEALVARLTTALETQAASQKWAQEQAQAMEAQERAAAMKADRDARIRALGYEPNDPGLQLFEGMNERYSTLEQRLAAYEKSQQEAQAQRQQAEVQQKVERYVAQMNGDVDRYLTGFTVAPETKTAIQRAAFALAQAHQIASPAEAAKEAIKMFAPAIGKRTATAAKATPEAAKAAQLMSVRGATAGKKAGAHASGRTPKRDVLEIEREFFKNKRFG